MESVALRHGGRPHVASALGEIAGFFDGLQWDVWSEERMGLEMRAESRRFLREARLAAAHVVVEPFAHTMVYRNLGMHCVSLPSKVVHRNRVFV